MIRKKRSISLDNINLTNPQRAAVTRVLTAQKNKYKKLLHEAHERLHIIADMTTSLEFWYNVNGSYEFVSPASEDLLGYAPSEFTGGAVHLEQLIHEDSIDRFRSDRSRALEGEAGKGIEYRLHTRSGETRWVQASWKPVYTRMGKHIGVRISIRDISEYKQCQYFSRAYRDLMLSIAEDLDEVGIFSLTPEWELKSWNSGARGLLGWEMEEMIGRTIDALLSADEAESTRAVLGGLACGERR
ncbi:MAG: PAS domain S-box protein, partial [Bacteroidota bacterium]|nr:PAS domain S-box protein [Bacteroidota bacterium]